MTQTQSPKIVKKKLFSPIWLLPLLALGLSAWLGIKSLQESGIEIEIHFPSATGIDVGKTLVRYQGLNIGKVVDISLDQNLSGVEVKVLMDYRAQPFLKRNTKFWLVTPKASITGVEGLDALFSGNYIAVQPGDGDSQTRFVAQREAPPMKPGKDGRIVELYADTLGSVDVGSQIFYRQIPVGSVVSYKLEPDQQIQISAHIKDPYANLVKTNSHFWNVSGIAVNASLQGINISSESLSAILAGGIAFSSDSTAAPAAANASFPLFESEKQANGGVRFTLTAPHAEGINQGTAISLRGITIGTIDAVKLTDQGVNLSARLFSANQALLTNTAQFYLQGAEISLKGIHHPGRLLTGPVIELLPGSGKAKSHYPLLDKAPDNHNGPFTLQAFSKQNPGIKVGATVKYRQFTIGQVTEVTLAKDFTQVNYILQIAPAYQGLFSQGSYLYGQSPVSLDASVDGISVTTSDSDSLLSGALILEPGQHKQPLNRAQSLAVYASKADAINAQREAHSRQVTLRSPDGAGLSAGSPVYFKKMQIGRVKSVQWQPKSTDFTIELQIDRDYAGLLTPNTVFWQNSAVTIKAGFTGVDVNVAPLAGAIKGSVSLAILPSTATTKAKTNTKQLYASEQLALAQAQPVTLLLPATAQLKTGAQIRYQGVDIGQIQQTKLSEDLQQIQATAWLNGRYADAFLRQDSRYYLVSARISLQGIEAPETLLTGAYIAALPGQHKLHQYRFHIQEKPDWYADTPPQALKLTLMRNTLGSIKIGTPILYRGLTIGQVKGVELATSGQNVHIYIAIDAKYRRLINRSSRFWDYSGIKVDVGLFSGAQIETGSLQTILAGGIAVATEQPNQTGNQLSSHTSFPLHAKANAEWLNWAPKLQ